jgi:DNA-binding transcriptional MerR regulator
VASTMTIGDFSRATRLSAKTLRFYHREGVLQPASIDAGNGYRQYDVRQIVDAQVVRQLRSLAVPVETIREILASDVPARNALISAHLERLQAQLDETRAAVTALRGLLGAPPADLPIEHRTEPATPALVVRQAIDLADLSGWYDGALDELATTARLLGLRTVRPRGGLWDTALFLDGRGEAVLFQPVATTEGIGTPEGRVRAEVLPPVDLAVAVHRGPDETMAQTYGALGAYVTEHEIGIDGPIRETYLQEATEGSPALVTEIGWPIFRTTR